MRTRRDYKRQQVVSKRETDLIPGPMKWLFWLGVVTMLVSMVIGG